MFESFSGRVRVKIDNDLIIAGPSNCRKTFVLKPLNTILDTSSKYAFAGIEKRS